MARRNSTPVPLVFIYSPPCNLNGGYGNYLGTGTIWGRSPIPFEVAGSIGSVTIDSSSQSARAGPVKIRSFSHPPAPPLMTQKPPVTIHRKDYTARKQSFATIGYILGCQITYLSNLTINVTPTSLVLSVGFLPRSKCWKPRRTIPLPR